MCTFLYTYIIASCLLCYHMYIILRIGKYFVGVKYFIVGQETHDALWRILIADTYLLGTKARHRYYIICAWLKWKEVNFFNVCAFYSIWYTCKFFLWDLTQRVIIWSIQFVSKFNENKIIPRNVYGQHCEMLTNWK